MELAGLMVGLGNPGPKYAGTRHNMGFWVLENFLEFLKKTPGCSVESLPGSKYSCELWRCRLPSCPAPWLLAAPTTFMNLSGTAVQPLMAWHKLEPAQLLVIHDELDLEPGMMKIKFGGGVAGHNGLKSIAERLSTLDFHRLRLGVGRAPDRDNTVSWVLGHPSSADAELWHQALPQALEALCLFATLGPAKATNKVNTRKKLADRELLFSTFGEKIP